MKNKIIGILVCMLMMFTAFSAVATTNTQEKSSLNQNTSDRGGFFTYLPYDPGYTTNDWYAWPSISGLNYQGFENFTDVAGPIRSIHWWGLCSVHQYDNSSFTKWPPGDPVGMTFDITFYDHNNTNPTYPGDLVLSYTNAKPAITATGIFYPEGLYSRELYFFEYNLTPSCNLSTGWISILSTGSDNDCCFFWMGSTDGDCEARVIDDGHWDGTFFYDLSLVLTDGEKPNLSIVDITGGSSSTLQLKNNGNATVDNYPVHFIVKGGIFKKIEVKIKDTISGLAPNNTTSLQTGKFFGLGKITIFVVGDGIIAYKHGVQLFMYTIIQNT
jgi:hypothetical protein